MIITKLLGGCKVGFFGLGASNSSLLSNLPLEKCDITLRSDRPICKSEIPIGIRVNRLFTGKNSCAQIDEDILFFSPSVRRDRPELLAAERRGTIFTSDAELFFKRNRTPVLAVTGSDGKSTTATLIDLLLKSGGHDSLLIGNIGEPMYKKKAETHDLFVAELSSFMLTYLKPSVTAACITNITPNHLDWHKGYEEYKMTKLSIGEKAERLILPDELAENIGAEGIISIKIPLRQLIKTYKAELYITVENKYILKNGEKIIDISTVNRREAHNIKNLMMAIAMTDGLVGSEEIRDVATSFHGLPHRCELFFSKDGVDYIDSSIDSSPARTVQTLKSLNRSVVIILGGRGKGLDYIELEPAIKRYAKKVIITGENAEEIYGAVSNSADTEIVADFDEAVIRGKYYSRSVGTLLLSPASTSFDRFKNYAERGEKFKEIVAKYQ